MFLFSQGQNLIACKGMVSQEILLLQNAKNATKRHGRGKGKANAHKLD